MPDPWERFERVTARFDEDGYPYLVVIQEPEWIELSFKIGGGG